MAYDPQWDHIDPHLLPITTPLHVGIWEQCLASHPDKQFAQYIVQGLHKGFCIGFDASSPLKAASRNMPSTSEQHDIVSKYLQEEIAEGRILSPFTPGELNTPIHISPIEVGYGLHTWLASANHCGGWKMAVGSSIGHL